MRNNWLSKSLCTIAIAAVSLNASAAEKAPGSGPNPFSDCGIGAALFPTVQWAAVISNVIWDIGTTAVTSATASPETCSGKSVETAMFIMQTYDLLAEETAKSSGEHLTAVLSMMDCDVEHHPDAKQTVREHLAPLVADASYQQASRVQKSAAYYDAVSNAAALHCSSRGA